MCDPVTAISTGLGVFNYVAGQSNAKNIAKSQNNALKTSYEALSNNQHQVNQSAALEKSDRIKEGMLERSKIAAIAGESGALGLSSDRLLNSSFMQEGSEIATIEKNRLNSIDSIDNKMSQAQSTTQTNINTTYNAAPSLIGTGLQIGADSYLGKTKATTKAKATV